MNYRVEDIPPEGLLVQGERDADWLKSLFQGQKRLDFKFNSPIFYRIRLSRPDSLVLVAGSINLKVELSCSRCLEKFIFPINPEFNFSLSPAEFQKLPVEMELQREDLDMEFYDGEAIDLGQIIQNQVILTIPFNPLCQENCKGLCPHCGTNKNKETCECSEEKIVDPRLEVLKNFFKK